ncbi:MAG: fasciclin domain-containing protein [Chloroflexota bacterium]|nr:fasciclin domain-containing protein [Chloroflexota bacterium]
MRKWLLVIVAVALLAMAVAPAFAQGRTIVDIAVADGRFDTLVAAVTAAGLADTLSSPGPFTVFAPTDTAFAALGEDLIADLLADPDGLLTDILLYHVVAGEVPASTVVGLSTAPTVNGAPVFIEVIDGGVVLDRQVNVVITDIQASNGIIHVIDAVLLPPFDFTSSELVFITGTLPVLGTSVGPSTTANVNACQTFFVTRYANGALKLRDIPGWIDIRITEDVPENYGIPNGTPRLSQCEGR